LYESFDFLLLLLYSNTFYRKYDPQIGRFTGVDIMAEEFVGINPYQFGLCNPILFNDPTGALTENPASFDNASSLLTYIMDNGIDGFDYEFNRWTFGGGGSTISHSWGNVFSIGQNKKGESVLKFSTFKMYNDGVKNSDGSRVLNSVELGTASITVQFLWNHALSWGETHRDASINFLGQTQHYDVMWRHNYNAFKERMSGGRALSKGGDRESYTESLVAMQAQYNRDLAAANGERIMLGVLAAPFVAYALAEIGVATLATSSTELVGLETYTVESLQAIARVNSTGLNAIFRQGITNISQAISAGSESGALQLYREGMWRYMATGSCRLPGFITQIQRVAQITKILGF
jgi:hypothetical protein